MKNDDIIKEVIDDLKPFINMEGGDIEFVKYDEEEKIVYVKLLGACAMCLAQDDTLEYGLLGALQEKIPEIKSIINVPI